MAEINDWINGAITKLAGIATGATKNRPDAELLARANHTGTMPATAVDESTNRVWMTPAERGKLSGVATGATANASDAALRNRASHTGTQPIDSIEGLRDALNAAPTAAAPKVAVATLFTGRNDPAQSALSTGGNAVFSYRTTYVAAAAIHGVRLVYSNSQLNTAELNGPAQWTIKAAFEMPGGIVVPVTFSGSREATVAPGADVMSDVVPVYLEAGASFAVRSRPQVGTLGQKWPVSVVLLKGTVAGGGGRTTDAVDTSAAADFTSSVNAFGPTAILATTYDKTKTLVSTVITGSSSAAGQGDSVNDLGDFGYLARAASAAGIGNARLAVSGSNVWETVGANVAETMTLTRYHRQYLERVRPSFVIAQGGSNDLTFTGMTLVNMQSRLLRYWDFCAGLGLPVVVVTYTPRVTGTYTTLAGQTAQPYDAVRQPLNTWLRTKPHPSIIGVLDAAAAVQDPTTPSKFRIDGGAWTADGTHLTSRAHGLVADALTAPLRAIKASLGG